MFWKHSGGVKDVFSAVIHEQRCKVLHYTFSYGTWLRGTVVVVVVVYLVNKSNIFIAVDPKRNFYFILQTERPTEIMITDTKLFEVD
jgi:hypothetical protein